VGTALARGQIPYLDDLLAGTGAKPLVARFHRDIPHPAQMARYYTHDLLRRVVCGLYRPRRFMQRKSFNADRNVEGWDLRVLKSFGRCM
jgi:hypothetical protein